MRRRRILSGIVFLLGVMLFGACAQDPEPKKNPSVNVSGENPLSTEADETEAVFPPMVMVKGKLYQDTGYVSSMGRCGVNDGTITSSVDGTKKPAEEDQSNFGSGYEYQIGTHRIDVCINKNYVIFWEVGVERTEIPEDVAHFEAEVTEVADGRMKIRLTKLPEEFRWIFRIKTPNELKPMDISEENLVLPKGMSADQLLGKTVKVWFDGKVAHTEPESSVPISLGQVYRIKLVNEAQ